jgi:hypothetical protein
LGYDSDKNFISVCDVPCIYSDSDSDDETAKCRIPPISTSYSDQNFKISIPSENLMGEVFGSND